MNEDIVGKVYQINVKSQTPGERGLPKHSVDRAEITFLGLKDDFNVYRHEKQKDIPDQAVLIMPLEMIEQLNREGWPIKPGDLGENITSLGISYDSIGPGKRYAVGDAILEITKPCTPCVNLWSLPYVGKEKGPKFIKTTLNRRGWYASVIQQGKIKKNDQIVKL